MSLWARFWELERARAELGTRARHAGEERLREEKLLEYVDKTSREYMKGLRRRIINGERRSDKGVGKKVRRQLALVRGRA